MNNSDFKILGIAIHLAASKSKTYRANILRYHKVLADFLQEKGLTTHPLLNAGDTIDETFKIMRSDLTDEGYELIKVGLDKWDKSINSSTDIENTTILERELVKIRGK